MFCLYYDRIESAGVALFITAGKTCPMHMERKKKNYLITWSVKSLRLYTEELPVPCGPQHEYHCRWLLHSTQNASKCAWMVHVTSVLTESLKMCYIHPPVCILGFISCIIKLWYDHAPSTLIHFSV